MNNKANNIQCRYDIHIINVPVRRLMFMICTSLFYNLLQPHFFMKMFYEVVKFEISWYTTPVLKASRADVCGMNTGYIELYTTRLPDRVPRHDAQNKEVSERKGGDISLPLFLAMCHTAQV